MTQNHLSDPPIPMVTFIPTSATSDTNSLVTPPLSVSAASSLSFDPKRFEAIDNLIHLKEQVSNTQVTMTSTSAPLTQDSVDSISSLPIPSLTSSSETLLGHDRSISDVKVTDLISNTNQIELQTPNANNSSLPDEQSQSACIGISHILTAAMNIEAMELSGEKRKRWKKPAKTVKQRFFLSPSRIHSDDSSDDEDEVEELVSATGRPKRKSTHNVSYEIKYDVKEEPVKKRGRGRPRKTPLKENDGNANVTTKRGRGRPRKTPLKEVDTNAKNKSNSGNRGKNSKKKVNSKKGKLTTSFDQRVNELANFKRKHGHMDVPYKYGPNQQLSNFCQNFRYSYGMHKRGLKPIMLVNDERIEKLKAIGFDFKNEATSA